MRTVYECELCHNRSQDRSIIEACEGIGIIPLGGGIKPGDVVYMPGGGYGWWSGDRDWFLEARGDKNSTSHHERGRLGYPLWIVLDLLPDSQVNTRPAHREIAVLYSPRHANYKSGVACGWTGARHLPVVRHREVSPQDLERYRAEARVNFPNYPRVALV